MSLSLQLLTTGDFSLRVLKGTTVYSHLSAAFRVTAWCESDCSPHCFIVNLHLSLALSPLSRLYLPNRSPPCLPWLLPALPQTQHVFTLVFRAKLNCGHWSPLQNYTHRPWVRCSLLPFSSTSSLGGGEGGRELILELRKLQWPLKTC